MNRPALEERFWAKVDMPDGVLGCWLWAAGRDRDGYGRFWIADDTNHSVRAHRWAYQHYRGLIPADLLTDHRCRTRHCVNPWHMEPVTPRDNATRSRRKGMRYARRMMPRDATAARLFEVAADLGLRGDRAIADALKVSIMTIWRIRNGHSGVGLTVRRKIRRDPRFARFSRTYLFPDEETTEGVPA